MTPNDAKLREAHLQQMIDAGLRVAVAKGWEAECEGVDQEGHRYATIDVNRYFGGTTGDVSAKIELTCDETIKVQTHPTSFHKNGLRALQDAIWEDIQRLPWVKSAASGEKRKSLSTIILLEGLFRRFHRSVRQLRRRHGDRTPLELKDEYDVQDYLHALLRALFDDIRAEEYTPSYAGGASRIDFLLKGESIAIEVKIASAGLRDRKIGEQLIIDVQRYQAHPGCNTLFCFVYDPDGYIQNPTGLERDLTKIYGSLDVRVIVLSPS